MNKHKQALFPFMKLLLKLRIPINGSGFLFGGLFYVGFIFIAWNYQVLEIVLASPMHLVQITFSICIALGLILLSVISKNFEDSLRNSKRNFLVTDDENKFDSFYNGIIVLLRSHRSIILMLPFMIIAYFYITFTIMPQLPDSFFPVASNSSLFLYLMIFEFAIFEIYLFGSIALWFLAILTYSYYKIGRDFEVTTDALDRNAFKPLGDLVLKACVFLSILVSIAMPILVSIVLNYSKTGLTASIGAWGLLLVALSIIIFFFLPQYFLHSGIVRAKTRRFEGLLELQGKYEQQIQIKSRETSPKIDEIAQLATISSYFIQTYNEIEKIAEWPFGLTTVLKLITSALIPIGSFVIQSMDLF